MDFGEPEGKEKELLPAPPLTQKSQPEPPSQSHHQQQPLQQSQQQQQHHGQSHSHQHGHSQSQGTSHGGHSQSRTSKSSSQQQQQQQFHRKSIGDWDFIRTIGAGSMGKVKLARHNATGEKCAVKIVPRAAKLYQRAHANDAAPNLAEEAAQRQKEFEKEVARDKRTIREGALGRLLFHPHICRLYEMVPMTNHYYMLFEYVEGGQLLDYIVSHGSLSEKYARKFARGVASALDYCHKNNVVHRDLKIENIMINQKGDIKIIDFGLSNLYSPKSLLKTYCGSLYFAAPELLSAKPYTGPEVDVWSFGVVLYVLVCGKVPFDDPVVSVLHEKIKRGHVEYPSFISKECVSLLSRMLVVDPTKRASLHEVIQHPWMSKGYEYPVPSYINKRVPLTLPLDPEIIKSIATLDLGSSQAIVEELTNVVSSPEYQMSSEIWYKQAKQGRPYIPGPNTHNLPDPTGGFNPLVSIYYLVDEMRKRKKAKEEALRNQLQSQLQESDSRSHDQVHQQINLQRQQHNTPVIASPPSGSPNPPQAQMGHPPRRSASEHHSSPQPPPKPAQPVPTLQFPEQAHTPMVPSAFNRESLSPGPNEGKVQQQMLLQHSPRKSMSGSESDQQSGKLGLNSLLRKLSGKKSHPHGSPTRSGTASPNKDDVAMEPVSFMPDVRGSQESSRLEKKDPLVRRGVSMKVTAKEKSSGSRVNVKDDSKEPARQTLDPNASQYRSHTRTLSNRGFVPAEYLPPLPTLTTEGTGDEVKFAKAEKPHSEKKFHPTARAKSVGGNIRKDAVFRGDGQHPALPNNMAAQNSDEGIDREHERNDAMFDDVTLDDKEYPHLPHMTEQQIVDQFAHARRNSMPLIEYPKTLFLKGFFSVQTTSTKPLPVIRYNILSVLTKLGVKFQEVKGGFLCVHAASIAPKPTESEDEASAIIDEYRLDDEEKKLYGDAFSQSSESVQKQVPHRASTPEPQDAQTPVIQTPQTRTPLSKSRGPSRQPSLHVDTTMLSPPAGGNSFKGHQKSNSIGGGHRRKFSIGQSILGSYRKKNGSQTLMPPNTPAAARLNKLLLGSADIDYDDLDEETRAQLQQFTDDDSVDSLNGLNPGGGSDMLVSSRIEQRAKHQRSPSASMTVAEEGEEEGQSGKSLRKTPLKFEINIVKVPLVGLYGVQFKKTLGNTWTYKTLASQILEELNL